MITTQMQDYPEHRLQFFSLLRAVTNSCFSTLFIMSPMQLKLVRRGPIPIVQAQQMSQF